MKNQYLKLCIVIIVIMSLSIFTFAPFTLAGDIYQQRFSDGNLLVNGDFDQLGFYWRPPNHFVADTWFEWWGDYNAIPEFIDGGHPYHNQCYPNLPNTLCHDSNTGINNSSQGLIKYGGLPFIAGIYKPVENVVPCTLYTFEIWNRNDADSSIYHPKIAIDPTGWIITRPGNSPPYNCPPDGISNCPDPYIGNDHGFPNTIIWSAQLSQPAYIWGKASLTVEAVNSTISVWTYTAPNADQVAKTTYWDYGSVVQTPFPGDKLPQPVTWSSTGFISSVNTSYSGSDLIISWNTSAPASSQVWYYVIPANSAISPTIEVSNTVYFPLVQNYMNPGKFPFYTPVQSTPTTHHQAVINGLNNGDVLTFVPLSRYLVNTMCQTASDESYQVIVNLP
jgi:hypothetical protein